MKMWSSKFIYWKVFVRDFNGLEEFGAYYVAYVTPNKYRFLCFFFFFFFSYIFFRIICNGILC